MTILIYISEWANWLSRLFWEEDIMGVQISPRRPMSIPELSAESSLKTGLQHKLRSWRFHIIWSLNIGKENKTYVLLCSSRESNVVWVQFPA